MLYFLALISGCFESIWRRWFGGFKFNVDEKKNKVLYKIVESRGTQTIFNFVFLTLVFMYNDFWMNTPLSAWIIGLGVTPWIVALTVAVLFQFMYWSRSHGSAFDIGRWDSTDYIPRYKNWKLNTICEIFVPEKYWYGFVYDCIWFLCRYSFGSMFIIPFIWTFKIMWLGPIITIIYAFCWTVYERDRWVIEKIPYKMACNATQMAELIAGFAVGLFLMLM